VTVFFESDDGAFSTSCVTSGTERAATCTVSVPFGSTIIASIDPSIVPDGYALERDVAQEFQIPDGPPEGIFGNAAYVLLPAVQDTPAPTEVPPEPTDQPLAIATSAPPSDSSAQVEEGSRTAALFNATCDAVDPAQPVASLNASVLPEGTPVGMEGAVPVATGFTVVPLPLADILAGGHSLAIVDASNPAQVIACGPVGGVLDSNGALTIGLTPVGDSGVVGVAYLAEQEDGAATGVSLFVMEQEVAAD
jgi:hypothetical protein